MGECLRSAMFSFSMCLLLIVAALSSVQALVAQALGCQLSARAAGCHMARAEACPCMACRQNLKKEKRLRNRINAFRFKKSGGFVRFQRPGSYSPEDAKKAAEDAEFFSLVFTASAAAEAEAAAATSD